MSKEFKQTFFTSLLVVLLVISNLIGLKLTNFMDLTISVDFLTYPFTFLCTLLIFNMGGKKSAYQSILISALIQIFITISYTLSIKLGTQTMVPDQGMYVNALFKVNELNILASLGAFLVSHYLLIYIYDNFKRYGKELYGTVISLLGSLFLNATIYLVIVYHNYDALFITNMLLSNIIISIIMVVIITILYYLLKEKDVKTVLFDNMNINVNNYTTKDVAIEELMNENKSDVVVKKNYKKSNSSNYKKNTGKNTRGSKSSSKKTTGNKVKSKTSQAKVKKD